MYMVYIGLTEVEVVTDLIVLEGILVIMVLVSRTYWHGSTHSPIFKTMRCCLSVNSILYQCVFACYEFMLQFTLQWSQNIALSVIEKRRHVFQWHSSNINVVNKLYLLFDNQLSLLCVYVEHV